MSTEARYLIAHIGHTSKSSEHVTWWKPDSRGYTICIDKAGLYSEAEARSICQYSGCLAVPKEAVEPLARSTPYYRLHNGNLARLYDGDNHRPVPNSSEAWKALILASIASSRGGSRPTPIGAKARAVYIDNLPAAKV